MPLNGTTLPEIVTSGIYDSRFVYPSGTVTTKSRRVSVFEIELPTEDEGISFFGQTGYSVTKNHILCAKPGQLRHTKLPYRCFFIHVEAEDIYYSRILENLPDILAIEGRETYKNLFESIIAAKAAPSEETELLLQSRFLELLYLLMRESKAIRYRSMAGQANTEVVKRAVEYIRAHYAEDVTLDDMAENVHLSSIYFHNMFKAAIGVTPHKFLLSVRLDEAKKQLAASTKPFAEIAASCGFPSQSYFNFVFKREFGITPRKYRTDFSFSCEE